MTDNYQNWMERVVGGRNAKPLTSGEVVKSSKGEPFGAVEFVKIPKQGFMAEVGKKGDTYIYHFFPAISDKQFYDLMSEALLEVFKREDQIEVDWADEMKAWAVRVRGWTDHVWGDELAIRAVDRLDELLRGNRS
jgi:hypothetical protein